MSAGFDYFLPIQLVWLNSGFMKQGWFVAIFMGWSLMTLAQDPVQWKYSAQKLPEQKYTIHLDAVIKPGWHIFSLDNISGPGPTNINFHEHSGFKLEGRARQLRPSETTQDPAFSTSVKVFTGKASFVQGIDRKKDEAIDLAGTVRYMACNGKNCLPPKTDSFRLVLN